MNVCMCDRQVFFVIINMNKDRSQNIQENTHKETVRSFVSCMLSDMRDVSCLLYSLCLLSSVSCLLYSLFLCLLSLVFCIRCFFVSCLLYSLFPLSLISNLLSFYIRCFFVSSLVFCILCFLCLLSIVFAVSLSLVSLSFLVYSLFLTQKCVLPHGRLDASMQI